MRVAGVWVGWGLGDNSTSDFTVRNAKAFMRKKFPSYAGHLADTNSFDKPMFDAVFEMQRRYHDAGRLHAPNGILDLDTQIVMGFKNPQPKVKPIIFTVEGHMSNPFAGPCAFTAQTLEGQGVCRWQPVGYDTTSLPFNNVSGINELVRLVRLTTLDNGVPFPAGTPWGLIDFSQGAIVGGEFRLKHLLPEGGVCHWRLKDLKRSLSFGNPYRGKDEIADWIPDPPNRGTQGISDVRLNAAHTAIAAIHREHSRHGDLYAENNDDESGRLESAVYKMIQNEWSGDAGIFNAIFRLFAQPNAELMPLITAVLDGGMFLFNMGPHGTYDLGPCIEWMRGVAA